MEDLHYAGINFGVIAFVYLISVFFILKQNTKRFTMRIDQTQNPSSSFLEAFVCWPIETKKNRKLICIEKVIYIFVIFTNQEVAQSIFEQQQNFNDDVQENLYKYLYIPLICFGGLLCQKWFYCLIYYFYNCCIFKNLEQRYPKTIRFAFSDPRSRSMFFFGYIISNLIVILVVFYDSKNDIFGRCIVEAVYSSLIQIFGLELIFAIIFAIIFKNNNRLYTILFQQRIIINQQQQQQQQIVQQHQDNTPLQ